MVGCPLSTAYPDCDVFVTWNLWIYHFSFHPFPNLLIPVWLLLTSGYSYGCCLDIDTSRISSSETVALLLHLENRKVRVNVFIGSLFCCTGACSTFPQVQKPAVLYVRVFYCRLFWRTASHFPVSHLKLFFVGDSNDAACPRGEENIQDSFFPLSSCLLYPSIWWVCVFFGLGYLSISFWQDIHIVLNYPSGLITFQNLELVSFIPTLHYPYLHTVTEYIV